MKTLKVALLSTVFAFGATSVASAADIYDDGGSFKDTPVVDYVAPTTWAGLYFGGHLGVGFNDSDNKCDGGYQPPKDEEAEYEQAVAAEIPVEPKKDCDDDDTFWLGGLHAGYNWQGYGPLVLGVEGDVSFSDDIDYLASIRGRIGFAMDSVLLYGTGGVAFIGLEDELTGEDFDDTGWVAGLGAEYKLDTNVSFGLEGLYYSFDDTGDDEGDFWVARARLSYHLTPAYDEPLK